MAEMIVTSPESKKVVKDMDIVFESGMMMPLTIDASVGDTYTLTEKFLFVNLTEKPSRNDPSKSLPAEKITIFLDHVLSIQERDREVVELTPDQAEAWKEDFKKMTGDNSVLH